MVSSTKQLSLSLVIPAYNEEHHLDRCLKSIQAQTVMPDEVLIIDNNSTDKTVDIARQYSFVTIITEMRQGVLWARNTGFDQAKGDIIGRIDADTILPPLWVANVKSMLQNPKISAVTGPVSYYDMPLPKVNYSLDHLVRLHLYRNMSRAPFLFGSNSALRKTCWIKVRKQVCVGQVFHEDLDLAIHLTLDDFTILYNEQLAASTSARRYDDNFKNFHRYMKLYLKSYIRHDFKSLGPKVAVTMYWIGYLLFRPWRLAYDDQTMRRSWRKLFSKHQSRKHPMSSR